MQIKPFSLYQNKPENDHVLKADISNSDVINTQELTLNYAEYYSLADAIQTNNVYVLLL